jgi:phosphohistidine phosphatase
MGGEPAAPADALDFAHHKFNAGVMRRLMLLRHAKSDRQPEAPDMERPLNERGAAAARLMGAYLKRHGLVPDLVLCSPARRTRDTLAEMTSQWPSGLAVTIDASLYLAVANGVLAAIRSQPKDAATVLVIGHNPGLQAAAEMLIASGDVTQRERLREKFPTGALAVIDFAVEAWSGMHGESGRLDRFVTPRSIAAATA